MDHDQQGEVKIAERYKVQRWLGVCSVEEAIQYAIEYRRALCDQERRQYDEAVLSGWDPERAMKGTEYAAGRDATLQQRSRPSIPVGRRGYIRTYAILGKETRRQI
jgi:hypothetical protein